MRRIDFVTLRLFVAIAAINLLSATQDVATDGLAVRLLGPRERGLGNGISILIFSGVLAAGTMLFGVFGGGKKDSAAGK